MTVSDRTYTPAEIEQISRLRHERWAILAVLGDSADGKTMALTKRQKDNYKEQLRRVQRRLFKLTQNPIYDVRQT